MAVASGRELLSKALQRLAILFEVITDRVLGVSMASGTEVIRKAKDAIREVDPREVHDLSSNGSANGAVLVDVREQHEFEESHIPGAVHVPRGHLESRIESAAPDKSQRVI